MKKLRCLVRAALVFVLCGCLLFSLASGSAATSGENDVANGSLVTSKVTLKDNVVNFFVKIVLLLRGSKLLFSSEKRATEYLDSLLGNQGDYSLSEKLTSSVSESHVGTLQCFTLTKAGSTSEKTVIYLPGGAFARDPVSQHWALTDELCQRTGARVIVVLYPKAPTSSCEATYTGLLELYTLLLQEGVAPENIIFMGDSAGGTISVTFTQWLAERQLPEPGQLILYSPVLNLSLENESISTIISQDPMQGIDGLEQFVRSWLGGSDINSPLLNPMTADLSVLPQTTIFGGTTEIFVFDNQLFYEKAQTEASNNVTMYLYEDMYHCFVLYPLDAADDAINKTVLLIG